jgi:site-specific DNA-methyltransferase (adenine-specific)
MNNQIQLYLGDCLDVMKRLPASSIDMVFTSPPYADRRASTYGGVVADKYIDWFLPIAIEIKRLLKPMGSFFLNIKPHTINGERSLYVFDLICSLRRTVDFMFVDELCWTKNAFPGKLKGRFKNGFEPIYHFTIQSPNQITFNPLICGTPIKLESIARSYRKQCGAPKNGSGMTGMNTTNIRNLKIARPSNVINIHNVSNQFSAKQLHPATFPVGLVEFFIKSFTNAEDTVLDPFAGSGTTGVACKNLNRKFIGIELSEEYIKIASERIKNTIKKEI